MQNIDSTRPFGPPGFTPQQRRDLTTILCLKRGQTADGYLDIVESYLPSLREDARLDADFPLPTLPAELATLNNIEKHSSDLFAAMRASYSGQAQMVLRTLLDRRCPVTDAFDIVENCLPFLFTAAKEARSILPQAQRGRPPDELEKNFISTLARDYIALFGTRPSYSRNTSFPRFVAAVLEIALPGNAHAVTDNSKILRVALEAAGLMPPAGQRTRQSRKPPNRRR